MTALTPQDIRHFRERLEAERHAIESRIVARNRDIQETVHEESGVGDSGDESLRIYDRQDETDANDLNMETLGRVNPPPHPPHPRHFLPRHATAHPHPS